MTSTLVLWSSWPRLKAPSTTESRPATNKTSPAGRMNGPGVRRPAGLARIANILRATLGIVPGSATSARRHSIDWLLQLGTRLRRRRASAGLGTVRVRQYARAAAAVIAGLALLVAGFAVFRVWSAIHTISPRAQPPAPLSLVPPPTSPPAP